MSVSGPKITYPTKFLNSFPTEEDLQNYRQDPDSQQIAHLREEAVKDAIFISGIEHNLF